MAFVYYTTKQYLEESSKWLNSIKNEENLAILFFPYNGHNRRAVQFYLDLRKAKIKVFLFNPRPLEIQYKNDLIEYFLELLGIKSKKKELDLEILLSLIKKKYGPITLIIENVDQYLHKESFKVLKLLDEMLVIDPGTITTLSFVQSNLLSSAKTEFLKELQVLLQNILYYPLYDEKDIQIVIKNYQKYIPVKIDQDILQFILRNCGHHVWLLKQALRYYKNNGKIDFQDPIFRSYLTLINNFLTRSDRSLILKLGKKDVNYTADELTSYEYFSKLNLIKDNRFTVPLLAKFIVTQLTKAKVNLKLGKKEEIIFNEVNISNVFSYKERKLMRLLLKKQGSLVSRDEIVNTLDSNEITSDWAIDQLVSRLRKRLLNQNINPAIIKTSHKRGYKLLYNQHES